MKTLITLTFSLLLALSTVFGQEKTNQSGNILFHATAKKEVTANATQFVSTIDLSANKIVLEIPVQNFKFKSSSAQSDFNNEKNMNAASFPTVNFVGDLKSNSEIEREGRHIVFVKGELTLKGVTKTVEFNGVLENKFGASKLNASFALDATAFGLKSEEAKQIEVSISVVY